MESESRAVGGVGCLERAVASPRGQLSRTVSARAVLVVSGVSSRLGRLGSSRAVSGAHLYCPFVHPATGSTSAPNHGLGSRHRPLPLTTHLIASFGPPDVMSSIKRTKRSAPGQTRCGSGDETAPRRVKPSARDEAGAALRECCSLLGYILLQKILSMRVVRNSEKNDSNETAEADAMNMNGNAMNPSQPRS